MNNKLIMKGKKRIRLKNEKSKTKTVWKIGLINFILVIYHF